MGDSKTAGEGYENQGQSTLIANLLATGNWPLVAINPHELAGSGWTASVLNDHMAAWLPLTGWLPSFVLVNIGANDLSVTSQSDFETALGGILDKAHAQWPLAQILVARIWVRSKDALSDTMDDTWIANVLATRGPWAAVGIDERVTIKAGDNGVTNSDDGTHPNAAGRIALALAWQTAMGY